MRILVTGGAGFIGSHIADLALGEGMEVRALDNLEPQVHGAGARRPEYLDPRVELVIGDVNDPAAVAGAVAGCEVVFHEAALVGVGQSMYQPARYTRSAALGTARLMEGVIEANRTGAARVRKVVVAASMSSYGEGAYECRACGPVRPGARRGEDLEKGFWEHRCPACGDEISPVPTPEDHPLEATSVYALAKRYQEDLVLLLSEAYGIEAVALRYFNVYGPRQSLSNPYTGVAAIFLSRLLAGRRPIIFEDGMQRRDFVHVRDVARANIMASAEGIRGAFNVATGGGITVVGISEVLRKALGTGESPEITGRFRKGDIRHCIGDSSALSKAISWRPEIPFEEGIEDLIEWAREARWADSVERAIGELEERGLIE